MQANVSKAGRRSRPQGIVVAAAAVSITAVSTTAMAQTPTPITWTNVGSGDWDNPANWDLARIPAIATNDAALISNGGTANVTGATTLAESAILDLGQTSGQTGHLVVSGGTLTLVEMRVGGRDTGTADTNTGGTGTVVQTGGDVNINVITDTMTTSGVQSLYIGDSDFLTAGSTANGSYNISAGNLNVGIATDDAIVIGTGAGTTASFAQSGGNVNSTGWVIVGRRGASASYTMSGGTLNAQNNDIYVGHEGQTAATSGVFTQTGGTVVAGNTLTGVGQLSVGRNGGVGTYNLVDGQVIGAVNINVGWAGTGTFVHGNGTTTPTATAVRSMSVGIAAGGTSSAHYTLNSGTLNVGSPSGNDVMAVGNQVGAVGTFVHQSGTVNVIGDLQLGRAGGIGHYNFNTGTLSASGLVVGGGNAPGTPAVSTLVGKGTFIQSGASTSTTISGNGNVGFTTTVNTLTGGDARGVLNLQAGSMTWTAPGLILGVGNGAGATGTINVSGGTWTSLNTSNQGVHLGRNGGTAFLNVSGTGVMNTGVITVDSGVIVAQPATGRHISISDSGSLSATTVNFGTAASVVPRTLNISGGSLSISGTYTTGSNGVTNITGGNVTIGTLSLTSGSMFRTTPNMSLNSTISLGNATMQVDSNTLTLTGGMSTPTGGRTLTKTGAGELVIAGAQTHTASTASAYTATAGTLSFTSNPTPNLNVNANANSTVNFKGNINHQLRNLNIGAGAVVTKEATSADRTLHVNALTIDPAGALDVRDNDLVVNSGTFADVNAKVLAGATSPTPVPGAISSTTTDGSQILALFDNALVSAGDWEGTTISANAIVGKYTYFGDANIDGQVTGDDYTVVDANLNTDPATGIEWLSGDMNLDGIVTGDDYTVIDANLGLGSGNPLSASSLGGGMPAGSLSAVPEPASIGVIVAAGAGMLLRRRRSSR